MPLRIAYVTSHPIQYQVPLFRALARTAGVDFKVFFGTDWGVSGQFDPGFGRRITWDIPLLEGYAHSFIRNVARRPSVARFSGLVNPTIGLELKRWQADVVVQHGYAHATSWLTMVQCRVLGIPVLLSGDSHLLAHRSTRSRLGRFVAAAMMRRLLAGAVAIGTLNREYWLSFGIPGERIYFAPYWVDNEFFQSRAASARQRAQQWRRELAIDEDAKVVVFAGKLIPVKDCATLIKAFGAAALPNTALVIVGEGELRQSLEIQAARFPGLAIKFVGFLNQTEIPAAYALADVFVLPSVRESWGLVVNEAMNLATAVIVSDQVGCAPDLVAADNGWVFPAGDVCALTRVLEVALAGVGAKQRLARMGESSLARISHWGVAEAAAGIVAAAEAVRRV